MADTTVTQVLKSEGWKEVAAGITAGFFTANNECLYVMSATTPTLGYGHRYIDGDAINFEKASGDKMFFKSDQHDAVNVVVTPK